MERKEIEDVVCNIMIKDGPDRHVDGYEVITDFIISLLENREYQWKAKYYEEKNIEY